MTAKPRFLALSLILAGGVLSAQNTNFRNPVLPADYPDPSVIRVGDDYWATATTSEWAPLFPILHSRDLINWEHVGNVFETPPEWSSANYWAPEIWHHRDRYYMYYVGRKKNGPLALAVATADKPTGPWTDHGPMVSQPPGSIDGVPVLDENGEPYLIWKEDGNSRKQPTILWIQKLSEDCTRLVGEMKELMRNDVPWEGHVIEGPHVVRKGDWFYLFYAGNACCGRGCNYALGVARSKKLLGPWEKNPANPILPASNEWKCPGHGTIVRDKDGRDFLLYHAYHAATFIYVGRQGLLDEITWNSEWPTINHGKGPSVHPGAPRNATRQDPIAEFYDDFSSARLRPEWQWPQNNKPRARIDAAQGMLVLSASTPERARDIAGGVLAVKTTSGDYTATTLLDVASLKPSAQAGLSAYGDRENALGITIADGAARVWTRHRNKEETVSTIKLTATTPLYLRMTATGGHRFRFATSTNAKEWQNVGEMDVEGQHLPPWDRGIRVALTVGGVEDASAKFDWLRVSPN
jgi:xylan 1,4-beta-xylosidase